MLVLEAEAISVGSVRSRFHAARLRLDAKRGSRSGGGPTNIRGTNRRALAAAQQRRPTTRGSCLSVWLVVNPMAGDGELLGRLPATFRVLPGVLSVAAPPVPAGRPERPH